MAASRVADLTSAATASTEPSSSLWVIPVTIAALFVGLFLMLVLAWTFYRCARRRMFVCYVTDTTERRKPVDVPPLGMGVCVCVRVAEVWVCSKCGTVNHCPPPAPGPTSSTPASASLTATTVANATPLPRPQALGEHPNRCRPGYPLFPNNGIELFVKVLGIFFLDRLRELQILLI